MMIQAFKQLVRPRPQGLAAGAGRRHDRRRRGRCTRPTWRSTPAATPLSSRVNLPADELRELFARASVYWHATGFSVKEPAAQEHFGITIIEGMAAGAVPVVFNSGGPPEIITSGENGYLFDTLEELVDDTLATGHRARPLAQLSRRPPASGRASSRRRWWRSGCCRGVRNGEGVDHHRHAQQPARCCSARMSRPQAHAAGLRADHRRTTPAATERASTWPRSTTRTSR